MMALAATQPRAQALTALLAGLDTSQIPEVVVSGVALDSRCVEPGDLFLACPGYQQHGLDHVQQAISAGAVAVAWDAASAPQLSVPGVRVSNLSGHAGIIAARVWQQPSQALFVTGITGTDGKTSCAHLLAQALDGVGLFCGYMGTLGYGFVDDWHAASHTTPDAVAVHGWLARLRANGAAAAAMEVSSHALAQDRVQAVAFDVAVLTNIGRDHLDYHGDMVHYAAAKRRLFDMPGLQWAVINGDDEYGRRWLADLPADVRPVAYGFGTQIAAAAPDYVAIRDVQAHPRGLTLAIDSSWGTVEFDSVLVGRFNAANLAAVLAVLLIRGIPPQQATQILIDLHTVPGRMERVPTRPGQPLVVVDYAHTPNALEQALQAVRAHTSGRVHCVFGCGGDRDRGKRPLMGTIAARHADNLWLTDDNPRHEPPQAIVADIVAGIDADQADYRVEHDRSRAIAAAINAARAGDSVLIAGKGHETEQQIGAQYRPHDDRVVARQVLEAA